MSAPWIEEKYLAIKATSGKITETYGQVLQQTKKLLETYDSIPDGRLDDWDRVRIERFLEQLVESELQGKEVNKLVRKLTRSAKVIEEHMSAGPQYRGREEIV